jgi:hypothetical protein
MLLKLLRRVRKTAQKGQNAYKCLLETEQNPYFA